ncbi:hypothetical protein B0H66DRAFT_485526 [Apodospora peruviana]|uniref:Uncharacterized protein n=1 Tax=Apodospora peruviana TaxID=516989 RepID=A0AAE0HUM4_9PEZI|nr:hypothetical protein B0H66DRAFT_485526 [Apodospora peruviana]
MAKVSGSLGPMAVFHRLWLAHALDCGMDWILRFADVMRNETTDEGEFDWSHGPLGVRSDAKLTDAARAVLSHFKITVSDKEDDKQYEDYLAETVRFLTCILDPRLPLLTVAPRRLPAGPGDFAFVPSTSNRSWIVVPAAIAHLPAYHNRSWIVEPFDPAAEPEKPEDHLPDPNTVLKPGDMAVDVYPLLTSDYDDRRAPRNDERGSWRLRRRDHIFGCQPWKAPINPADFPNTDDGAVVYMKKQRVYGAEDYDWKSIHAAIRKIEDAAKLGEVI